MRTGIKIISCLIPFIGMSQVSAVYKINELIKRISYSDTVYVVNFWATWCKPCVQELPAFDSLSTVIKNHKVKILLVSLDFAEDLTPRVNPFLIRNKIRTECVLLDEVNGNDFINKIAQSWSGAIPATYLKYGKRNWLAEKKFTRNELQKMISEFTKEK
jgi:thiol-disulfide isomerase/thioredoxin